MRDYFFLFVGMILTLSNFVIVSLFTFVPVFKTLVYVGYLNWLFGVILWITAAIQLRNSAKEKNYMQTNQVVSSGIYSYLRHPQYFGFMLFAFGFPLIGQHYSLIIISCFAILFLYSGILQEERQLIKLYGCQYKEYMKETSFMKIIRKLLFKRS